MRDLRALPKAHLHLHLEGAMRPATLADLAAGYRLDVPALGAAPTFAEFMALYRTACDVLRRPDDVRRLLREVGEDAAADGCVWVEPHVYPPLLAPHLGDPEGVLELLLDAAREAAEATGVGVGLLVAADRTLPPADAERWAALAAAHAGRGVTTFGLANDEARFPPEPFAAAFTIAGDAGLLLAPHAGELAGPASVRGALDHLRPHRLAHGVRAVEEPALLRHLADAGVTCDLCPTSNLVLGLAPSAAEHPLPRFVEAGVPVTINADDPLMFGAGILDEYELARRAMALDDTALAGIARTSILASGAPPAMRGAAAAGVDAWLATPA